MNFWAVIPSRYGSTRFPGKPLALVAGTPLLKRVVDRIRSVSGLKSILVATDHSEIKSLCEKINVEVMMTDSDLESGTDRIYQALLKTQNKISSDDVVINVQGDEPLIPAAWIEKMISLFQSDEKIKILTLAHKLTQEELANLNSVKVIVNKKNQALYFSRFPIPHSRDITNPPISLKHVGIYGYRWSTLESFCRTPVSDLEKAESLEQLRALDMGISIHVMTVEGSTQGVDVPEDIPKVEKILKMGGYS